MEYIVTSNDTIHGHFPTFQKAIEKAVEINEETNTANFTISVRNIHETENQKDNILQFPGNES